MVFIRGNKLQAIEAWLPCPTKKWSMFPMHMFKLIRSNILFWSSFKTCCEILKKKKEKKTSIVKCKFETREQEISSLIFERWFQDGMSIGLQISQPVWLGFTDQQPLPSAVLSKHEVLDRFEQHTQKCSSCKRTCEFQTLQKFLIGATVAFLH
ncbi:hypothetical protein NC651_021586 [Populus alba x Populus x berolinensis]|nr:hypothetical protein NC651_021586 [Populus alba x Populus x berolinensis]